MPVWTLERTAYDPMRFNQKSYRGGMFAFTAEKVTPAGFTMTFPNQPNYKGSWVWRYNDPPPATLETGRTVTLTTSGRGIAKWFSMVEAEWFARNINIRYASRLNGKSFEGVDGQPYCKNEQNVEWNISSYLTIPSNYTSETIELQQYFWRSIGTTFCVNSFFYRIAKPKTPGVIAPTPLGGTKK